MIQPKDLTLISTSSPIYSMPKMFNRCQMSGCPWLIDRCKLEVGSKTEKARCPQSSLSLTLHNDVHKVRTFHHFHPSSVYFAISQWQQAYQQELPFNEPQCNLIKCYQNKNKITEFIILYKLNSQHGQNVYFLQPISKLIFVYTYDFYDNIHAHNVLMLLALTERQSCQIKKLITFRP